jgi:hypothetical protein
MRTSHSHRFVGALIAGLVVMVAAPASAVTIHDTDGTRAFTGSATAFTCSFSGGNGVWKSTIFTANGSTSSPSDTHLIFHPVLNGLSAKVSGVTYSGVASLGASGWSITVTNSTAPFTFSTNTQTLSSFSATGLTGSLSITGQTRAGAIGSNSGMHFLLGLSMSGLTWTTTSGSDLEMLLGSSGSDGVCTASGNINLLYVNVS